MYNCKFISSRGETFVFGKENNIVFDLTEIGGIPVNLGTSSRFSQVGESVLTQSVDSKTFLLNGVIFDNIPQTKATMGRIFSAFTDGRLEFNGEYFIDVFVKTTPTFKPQRDNGKFVIQLMAPVPYFSRIEESKFSNYTITPAFSFPVNYETPHKFANVVRARQVIVSNYGDVKTPFVAEITTANLISNFTITDVITGRFLKFNGDLTEGQKLKIYRDAYGYLNVDLIENGISENAFYMLDEDSNLFEFEQGLTVLEYEDDNDGDLTIGVTFSEMVGAVYEH